MAKLVYLREIGVSPDQGIVDRLPVGFYRRFKMHAGWVSELYLKYLYKAVKIPDVGKVNVELTDEGNNPPEHVPGSHYYRWRFPFDAYIHAHDDERKQLLFDAIHTALAWNAEQEKWPIEPFQLAYDRGAEDGLVCETTPDRSWASPCKQFRVRIRVLQELEIVKFSAALFRNRRNQEVERLSLGSVVPTGQGVQPFVEDCSWISPTVFELRSKTFAQQTWQADFRDSMQSN